MPLQFRCNTWKRSGLYPGWLPLPAGESGEMLGGGRMATDLPVQHAGAAGFRSAPPEGVQYEKPPAYPHFSRHSVMSDSRRGILGMRSIAGSAAEQVSGSRQEDARAEGLRPRH